MHSIPMGAKNLPKVFTELRIVIYEEHERIACGLVEKPNQLLDIDRLGNNSPGAGLQD
jgi:hypothetical protein